MVSTPITPVQDTRAQSDAERPASARAPTRRPRVVWDMTFTHRGVSGTQVYTQNLWRALAASDEWQLQELDGAKENGGGLAGNFRNLRWLMSDAAQQAEHAKPDLFHAAAYLAPRGISCPLVVNVFDTSYVAFPQYFDWKWKAYARTIIPDSVRRAAAIITLSNHARSEIARIYTVPAARVHVIYPGIGSEFHPVTDPDAIQGVRAKYGISSNSILYGGGAHPRKNIAAVIGAFALARREFPDLTLTLFGAGIPRSPQVQDALRQYNVANQVTLLDLIPAQDLPSLYASARVFVYASKVEGFGMPPVEAMACGTPVVAAPNPPIPEVLGDAALLTADDSPAALAEGICRVLGSDALAQTLSQRGTTQASSYTWQRAAAETLAVYRQVLSDGS